ncbi:protein CREG1-like [Convolutriloba macropyga]|uniref:protein CREG1-like n=1 Tax=Convolutriloba macropyga TaxID=536237 RepID=UPI003F51AEA6
MAALKLCAFTLAFALSVMADKSVPSATRPPYTDVTTMARYVVHEAYWCVIGTISTMDNFEGSPFTNILSIVDGPVDNSTGVPYFYTTDLDQSSQDIMKNNTVSISISEYETDYCKDNNIDPESPTCTRITMIGKFVKVTEEPEKSFALNALYSRHPAMVQWSHVHSFYPAKLEIELIWVIDFYGGASILNIQDYYNVNLN